MNVFKNLIYLFTFFVTLDAFCFISEPLIYEVEEKVSTLEKIAKTNHFHVKDRFSTIEKYVQKLREWNPHIKNENKIFMGTEIYVDYPYSPSSGYKWAPKIFWATKPTQPRYSFFGFLTTSMGTFNETVNSQNVTVTSKQNSPITFGLGGNFPFDADRTWSINTSIYASYLTSQTTNRSEETSIDPEVGVNLYLQYALPSNPYYSFFTGLDIERFSTFNTDDLITGASIDTRTQLMSFATLGFNRLFMPGGKPFLFKISYSQGVTSSSNTEGKEFTGSKYMIYLNYKLFSKILVHLLYKHHSLTGPTDLSITRYGAGIGWSFK